VIFCSGKVYVDLITSPERERAKRVAIIRIEELYPFPEEELRAVLNAYPNLREVVWLQEEPKNMGAWSFMQPRLRKIVCDDVEVRYTGRTERASPAEGPAKVHAVEQARIVDAAFSSLPTLAKAELGRTG
jgi:2-oxoglutarate dehydrogenase E1 component